MYLYLSIVVTISLIGVLSFIKKSDVSLATVYIKESMKETGEVVQEPYILTTEKINISNIKSVKVEFMNGYQNFGNEVLKYKDGLLTIKEEVVSNIKKLNGKIWLYKEKISLLKYLLNSFF